MKSLRFLPLLVVSTALCTSLAAQQAAPSKAAPKAKPANAQEPITLEFGNMKSEKPKLLSLAKYLKDNAARKDTAGYAGQYHEMLRLAKQVGTTNFAEDEAKLIMSVPEPTAEAIESYNKEKSKASESVNQRISESDAAVVRQQQQRKLQEAQQAQQQAGARQSGITQIVTPAQSNASTTQAQPRMQQQDNLPPPAVPQVPVDARLEGTPAPVN